MHKRTKHFLLHNLCFKRKFPFIFHEYISKATDREGSITQDDGYKKYTKGAQYFSDFLKVPNSQRQIKMSPGELIIRENRVDGPSFKNQQDLSTNSIGGSANNLF